MFDIIHIHTGRFCVAAVIEDYPADQRKFRLFPYSRFWGPNEIKKDGTPDRRNPGTSLARMTDRPHTHPEYVKFAVFNPEVEAEATLLREEIDVLKKLIDRARRKLVGLYAPVEPAEKD